MGHEHGLVKSKPEPQATLGHLLGPGLAWLLMAGYGWLLPYGPGWQITSLVPVSLQSRLQVAINVAIFHLPLSCEGSLA